MSVVKTNRITTSTGTGSIVIPAGNTLYAPGHVVQVQVATSGPALQTINNTLPVAVTGLSIDFTPISATSRILIQIQLATAATFVTSYGIYRDGSPTVDTTGFTNLSNPNMQLTTYIGSNVDSEMWSVPIMWSEIAGSTDMRTYALYASSSYSATISNLRINNRGSNDMASFSHMTIMEIAQ